MPVFANAVLCLSAVCSWNALQSTPVPQAGQEGTRDSWRDQDAAIERELAELATHPWAGAYQSPLFFESWTLRLAPRSGFVFSLADCAVNERNLGTVSEKDGLLRLHFARPNRSSRFQGFPATLVPVAWGERRYLASSLLVFCNTVNSGLDVGDGVFVRVGDLWKPAPGKPQLPADHARYLLDQPLLARVVEVAPAGASDPARPRLRATLDVGSAEGAFHGMWLWSPGARSASPVRYEIVDLREHTCMAEESARPLPKVGLVLSTRRSP